MLVRWVVKTTGKGGVEMGKGPSVITGCDTILDSVFEYTLFCTNGMTANPWLPKLKINSGIFYKNVPHSVFVIQRHLRSLHRGTFG
jgi:hypothetical protein